MLKEMFEAATLKPFENWKNFAGSHKVYKGKLFIIYEKCDKVKLRTFDTFAVRYPQKRNLNMCC